MTSKMFEYMLEESRLTWGTVHNVDCPECDAVNSYDITIDYCHECGCAGEIFKVHSDDSYATAYYALHGVN